MTLLEKMRLRGDKGEDKVVGGRVVQQSHRTRVTRSRRLEDARNHPIYLERFPIFPRFILINKLTK